LEPELGVHGSFKGEVGVAWSRTAQQQQLGDECGRQVKKHLKEADCVHLAAQENKFSE